MWFPILIVLFSFAFLTINYCAAGDEEGAGPGERGAGPDHGRHASKGIKWP